MLFSLLLAATTFYGNLAGQFLPPNQTPATSGAMYPYAFPVGMTLDGLSYQTTPDALVVQDESGTGGSSPGGGIYSGVLNPNGASGDSWSHHTLIWARSFFNSTTGAGDIAVGGCALCNGDQGTRGDNIAVGVGALEALTTGYNNVGLDLESLARVTTGYNNVGAGTVSCNGITTGHDNICVGPASLQLGNPTQTVAIGSGALAHPGATASPSQDVVIGANAGQNLTGSAATIVGYSAASSSTSNTQFVAIGNNTAQSSTASFSVFVGSSAGNSTSSDFDTCVGFQACYSATSGGGVTAIGSTAAVQSAADTNETMLGNDVKGAGSNTVTLGNAVTKVVTPGGYCPGNATTQGTACYYSGTGVPTFSAPNASQYLRYDGGTGARVYYNTSGASTSGTTWTAQASP